jgi:soluble lytic murein transglycosylase
MTKTIKILLYVFAVLLVFAILLWNTEFIERQLYPIEYRETIDKNADKHGLNPYLVAAIIRAESNYVPNLVSAKGAIGVMQLMPDTANWIAEKMGRPVPLLSRLNDAEYNIELGTWYMRYLLDQFNGNEVKMIAAYNAGPTNVRKWLDEKVWDGTLASSTQIPFGETRHYIKKIEKYFNIYEKVYHNGHQLNEPSAD